jgi:hypothetical protein
VTPQNRAGGQAERALCAPEDVHQSLKEFSATDSVANNDGFAAEPRKARKKKKLRKRAIVGSIVGSHFRFLISAASRAEESKHGAFSSEAYRGGRRDSE